MIRINKITDNNFELTICDKLKGILDRDEALSLFWELGELLDQETRSKW